MPRAGVLLGTGLVSSTIYPYSITIGGVEVAPTNAELQSITFQDNGDDEPGTLSLRLWDSDNTLAVKDQGVINVAEYATGQQVWGGVVQRKWYDPAAVGRYINVEGISFSTLLNEIFIVRETRPAESDRTRALYLWGKYARWPLSTDMSQVTETNASIAADDILSMTLGSALRFTMALSGSTNRMAIDPLGRLHWFAGTETNPAPYNINVALAPGGTPPLAYWRLGETSGTTAVDETGNYDGTYVNTPTLGATGLLSGDANTAVTLNGTTQYLTAPIAFAGDMSAAIWIKTTTTALRLAMSAPTGGVDSWWLGVQATGVPRFAVGAVSTSGVAVVNDDVPHLLVATVSGTTTRLYVDGQAVGTPGTLAGARGLPLSPLQIGRRNDGFYTLGTIDEPAIWDRALTADEIAALYAAGTSGVAPTYYNTVSPLATRIAPDAISVERDGVIKNRAYVRGSTLAGSGWFQDDASVATYGPRETPIDAPSADTAAKARSIALMYFGRVAQPRTRGSFQTEEPYTGWRAGQNVTITDPANDLSAQAFRIARVTTKFTKGTGTKAYRIEFGGVRPRRSDIEDDILGRTLLPGQAVAGDTFDNDGNLLLSSGLSGSAGGFGPAMRRYITSGVYNGDFALAPPYPDSSIVEAWNPLPFWTFTQAGGTSITAQSAADSSSGSGRVLQLSMAGGGIAGDDSYIEQIIPVIASRSQAFAYRVRCAFLTGPTTSTAKYYITAQYLKGDGITTTGTSGSFEAATNSSPASTVVDQSVVANGGGQVPTDAQFLRLRIGFKRDVAATTVTETLTALEAYIITGSSEVMLQDLIVPTYNPSRILVHTDVLYLLRGADIDTVPRISLRGSDGQIKLTGRIVFSDGATAQALVAGTTITPSALVLPVTATAPITLTSAPTVSNGADGQVVVIVNTSANAITIQDQGTLAGSNLRLSTATFALGTRDSITLLYSATIGDWIEIARTNVL